MASTSSFSITVNGEARLVSGIAPTTTLLEWLRATGLTGTKEGCAEGDCGACTVAIIETDQAGKRAYRAINACITLLGMVADRELVTVEGIGERATPHPVQRAMIEHGGSQCGYCTPGVVASMFEGYYRDDIHDESPTNTRVQLADQLSGNLCRCTGYRPIRDAAVEARCVRQRRLEQKAEPDLFELRLRKPSAREIALDYAASGERFLRPTTLTALAALRAQLPDAVVIAGATEIGVERNKKSKPFPLLISTEGVAELRAIERGDRRLTIGGAATLTQLEEAIGDRLPSLKKMLLVFAARQIRNRATLAGNLVTASPIGDLAPVLLSLDATIELVSQRGTRSMALDEFFLSYRKTALAADEIVRSISLHEAPSVGLVRRAQSYKVSKRRELDISIVAAAFTVDTDADGLIRHARLAFGGVAATPVRARATETMLLGRPWSEATMRAACDTIVHEFEPIDDVRAGKAFRSALVVALLQKFFLGVESEAQDLPLGFVPTVNECPSVEDPSRALRHESAWGHVSGSAIYVDDQASRKLPGGVLELWPVMATQAHARVLALDVSAARAMTGVVDVITAREIPGENDIGAIRKDEPLLADRLVQFHGQMLAVIVGTSLAACRAAAAMVVVDYEPLLPILGLERAIAARSFHTEPHVIARGDADRAIATSARRLSGALSIGGQEHFYLESQAAWAEAGDDGDVTIVSSTQHPTEVQAAVSHALHLPRNKVVVQAPRMGGGFGGKETQGSAFAALVALAAMRTGRPVRVQLDRDVDMILTGKRHPFHARYEVGFDEEGLVVGLKVWLTSDGGYALDLSESILDRGLFHLDNSYYLPAVRFEGRVAKTNVCSHTAFRGFGGPQGMLVIEEVLDRIARALGVAPEVVRARNLYRGEGESNTTHYGQHLDDNRIQRIWSALESDAKLPQRRAEIAQFNHENAWIKRGIAMTPVKFGISFTASFLNQAGALVLVYRDGTVQVNHGGTEMGQGLNTKMLGVAMRELGLPASSVRVMKTQTDKVPNTSATAASSGADLNGAAVRHACVTIRERLAPVALEMIAAKSGRSAIVGDLTFEGGEVFAQGDPTTRVAFSALVERAYMSQISLSANGFYRTPGLAYDKKAGHGKPFFYFAYGAAVTEVEVDGLTGMKRVRRVDILHDVGDSLNPRVDRGQIEGAFVQGLGWLTGEELKWDGQGRLQTHSASTYQIPAISDAPVDLRVTLLERAPQAGVIHGSKAVGEPPLMLAISAREAIRDAIAAFGAPGGDVPLASPATHEAIFQAVGDRIERRTSGAGSSMRTATK